MEFGSDFNEDVPFSNSSSQLKTPCQIYDNHHHQMDSRLGTNNNTQQQQQHTSRCELIDEEQEEEDVVEREHMFDKAVTPSDVGKLNRLVIPKQHAEKYFPLDSSTNDKGLLLDFEDTTGKAWRFRYSYWNSSQSYVMTKGWSRFVKDKKLYAGDIVSFQRGMGDSGKHHFYIDWRRRPNAPDPASHNHRFRHQPWTSLLMRPPAAPMVTHLSNPNRSLYNYNIGYGCNSSIYNNVVVNPCSSSGTIVYPQQVQQHKGGVMIYESVPVVQGKAAANKRLRLFGVNMDCPITDSEECDKMSANSVTQISSSTSQHHPLRWRLYNGTSSTTQFDLQKDKSLDLDI